MTMTTKPTNVDLHKEECLLYPKKKKTMLTMLAFLLALALSDAILRATTHHVKRLDVTF